MGIYHASSAFGWPAKFHSEEKKTTAKSDEQALTLPAGCVGLVLQVASGSAYIKPIAGDSTTFNEGIHVESGFNWEGDHFRPIWIDPVDPPAVITVTTDGGATWSISYFTVSS